MRVTYNQTPPPVVEESGGVVSVNQQLVQVSLLGFSGAEHNCVKLLTTQPARLVFTLGSSLVVRDVDTGARQVHVGHRYPVTCMTLSPSGQYLVTGETATMGVRAVVNCWDTRTWSVVASHQTHHAKVQSLAINDDDSRMVSLGGQDDQSVVVWNLTDNNPVCSHTIGKIMK